MSEVVCEPIIPTVEEVPMDDKDSNLADYAFELLKALRSIEENKDSVESSAYIMITKQLWAALDDVTLRLFNSYIQQPAMIESN